MSLRDVSTNLDGRTVAADLAGWWESVLAELRQPPEVSIASAYFNVEGFRALADPLEQMGRVRLLIGAEPEPGVQVRTVRPLGVSPSRSEQARTREALKAHARRIEEDRNLLPFSPEVDRLVDRLIGWLESGRVEVRRFEGGFLHGKAYLLSGGQGGVLVGSSNLTGAGLRSNVELNMARADRAPVEEVAGWFERLWEQSGPYDLAGLYRDRFAVHDPYVVYLRMLWERYHDAVGEEEQRPGELPLARFQRDGVSRAAVLVDRHGGVLIADGVGLGKTFVAGELLRQAVQERRQRALVIAPAALRDGPWRAFLHEYQLPVEVVSFDQIRDDRQLSDSGTTSALRSGRDEYALVVIDEAHGFRNPSTQQAQALRRLLAGSPPKQVVLLTATPVNNSLSDLYELIRLFVRNDAAFLDAGIPSLREHFVEANREHPDALSPELLFDVLDAIAVRRTRRFVKRFYPNEVLRIGGREVPLVFPQPTLRRIDYDFDAQVGTFFDDFAYALGADPDDDTNVLAPSHMHDYQPDRRLTMARYVPSAFRLDGEQDQFETQVEGLLRIGLLKRFESSPYAFSRTCRTMVQSHDRFVDGLDGGWVLTGAALDLFDTDTDVDFADLDVHGRRDRADDYDTVALRTAVEQDRDLLLDFAVTAEQIANDDDLKLGLLIDEIVSIVGQAAAEAINPQEERNKRKTLIFTYYTDTLDWITRRLASATAPGAPLELLHGRVATISGRHRTDEAMFGFAPDSTEAPPGTEDAYDLLVATDVLAEGVNLQQARHIINFDLPWNPMRLVQRHGRIDRIGSPHDRVWLRTLFPTAKLDGLLALEDKIRRKLTQAARSIGVEDDVIAGINTALDRNFAEVKDQVERIRDEDSTLLDEMDATGALSGEEFRRELTDAMRSGYADQIINLPWVAGTGRTADARGFVFCARVGDHPHPIYRWVPTDQYGQPVADQINDDTLRCLALARCTDTTPTVLSQGTRQAAYHAWAAARDHIRSTWDERTDPANLQPRIAKPLRQAAELLRTNRPGWLNDTDYEHTLEILETAYEPRIERAFRQALDASATPETQIRAVLEVITTHSLTPPQPIKPLPEIIDDDIHLVTWMALINDERATT